jgi:MBOAT, membrane-bound O-acyltransferase family
MNELSTILTGLSVFFTLRMLPFAVYGTIAGARTRYRRTLTALGYAALPAAACWLGAERAILLIACGMLYYLVVSQSTNRLSSLLRTGRWTRSGVLTFLVFVYLFLPGVICPRESMGTFLVVGCELAMSAYSYCVETSRPGAAAAGIGNCLFFLFVNPTLFYGTRGRPIGSAEVTRNPVGLVRAFVGLGTILLASGLKALVFYARHGSSLTPPSGETPAALAIPTATLSFLGFYAGHSGLASLQIGMMRWLGWEVPERYKWPLLSTSPMDFWRRWNTYMRVWLEAYVFVPIARRIAQRTRSRSGQVAAAVVTFVASGLLHDVFSLAGQQAVVDPQITFFLWAAIALVTWRLSGALVAKLTSNLDGRTKRWLANFGTGCGRLVLAAGLVMATLKWG